MAKYRQTREFVWWNRSFWPVIQLGTCDQRFGDFHSFMCNVIKSVPWKKSANRVEWPPQVSPKCRISNDVIEASSYSHFKTHEMDIIWESPLLCELRANQPNSIDVRELALRIKSRCFNEQNLIQILEPRELYLFSLIRQSKQSEPIRRAINTHSHYLIHCERK